MAATKSYISACGMVTANDIERTHEQLDAKAQDKAVYGVQVSAATLLGELNQRGPQWYPRGPERLAMLCRSVRQKNLGRLAIHVNTKTTDRDSVEALVRLVELVADGNADLLQLNNLDWLQTDWSGLIRTIQRCGAAVILQANTAACQVDPNNFARALQMQNPDYVLLDTSGGKGEPFDAALYAHLIERVQAMTEVAVGIAGGLGPIELHNLAWLTERFDDLSCDAETKLRSDYDARLPSRSRYDPLAAARYIAQVTELL
jgi:hypothetical protein